MKKKFWLFLAISIGGVIYYFFNPSANFLFPKCPFKMLTGLDCPGCGSQRAIHSLLHLDLMGALHYNAFLVFSLPVVVLLFYAEWQRTKKPRLYAKIHRVEHIWGYFLLVIIWWVVRNLL